MDAAFENRFEDRWRCPPTDVRRVSMEKSLTETEYSQAVSDGLPQLIAVARRLAGNEEIAAEAVQNALLKASKSWRKFRGNSHVTTWLTKIVIHAVRDAISAEHRRRIRTPSLPPSEQRRESENIVDPQIGPQQKILDEELRSAILAAVRNLPDRQREVFSLMVWQGMSAKEVGLLLDASPQTVHANLHAARKQLQEMLQQYVHGNGDSDHELR